MVRNKVAEKERAAIERGQERSAITNTQVHVVSLKEEVSHLPQRVTDALQAERSRQSMWLPPELPLECELVSVTFGGQTSSDAPAKMHTNAGFQFGNNQPFRAYVRSNRFFVEAEFASDTRASHRLKIANGQVSSIPPSCDKNFNANAFEIVDNLNKPILQLIYKTPEHVVINGLFEGGGVRTFAFGGTTRTFPQTQPFPLAPDRVAYFKYPSSKYRGVVAE